MLDRVGCSADTPPRRSGQPWPMASAGNFGHRCTKIQTSTAVDRPDSAEDCRLPVTAEGHREHRTSQTSSKVQGAGHSWLFCALEPANGRTEARANIRRYTGDRRSPSPSGRITPDIRVIIAQFFGLICGDDHPCITRSDFLPEQWKRPHDERRQGRESVSEYSNSYIDMRADEVAGGARSAACPA